ncbi:MAG: C1 family peptidase [Elusimicrobia bacterium]|nr:C1 family peptidase [Elusimicrobiota bacterium]
MKNNKSNFISGSAAFLILFAGLAPAFSQETPPMNVQDQIARIQAAIREKGAKWTAGETSLSNLSLEEWQARVGYNFQPLDAPPLTEDAATEIPASVDWRNYNGNFVTPVRDQKKCGSCWAFALTGGLESYVLRTEDKPGVDLDLSEQIMVSCSGVGSCSGGYLSGSYLKRTGLPPESYYPYTATNGKCSTAAAGWQNAAYKVGAYASVSQKLAAIKSALANYGPLPTALMVYEDFMHYKSGIYSYTTGKKLGGHAVLLVGYNDAEQYFIVKNSWNTKWGEEGYFNIAYSEINSVVRFGLSTIVYQTKTARDGASWQGRTVELDPSTVDEVRTQLAPMFRPLLQWNR